MVCVQRSFPDPFRTEIKDLDRNFKDLALTKLGTIVSVDVSTPARRDGSHSSLFLSLPIELSEAADASRRHFDIIVESNHQETVPFLQ